MGSLSGLVRPCRVSHVDAPQHTLDAVVLESQCEHFKGVVQDCFTQFLVAIAGSRRGDKRHQY